ncbi:MAG: dephospho-CoA kinase [Flavobacteriales bacterium]
MTGGIGSGKSTIARVFEVLGAPVFHADDAAKELMASEPEVRAALIGRFGEGIYREGALDRAALASIIFRDEEARMYVNAVVHPAVRAAFDAWARRQSAPYVLLEAALMAENGGWKRFDRVIVVSCPEPERIRRVMARDGAAEEQVRARMRSQASEEERLAIAHHVILADGRHLEIPQVLTVHEALLNSAR